MKTAIVDSLRDLLGLERDELLERRYARFRKFGTPGLQPTLSPVEDSP